MPYEKASEYTTTSCEHSWPFVNDLTGTDMPLQSQENRMKEAVGRPELRVLPSPGLLRSSL